MTTGTHGRRGAALDATAVRLMAAAAAEVGPLADLALVHAELRAFAEQDGDRAVAVARLALDLRRAIDTNPDGWVLLVAELALRAAEQQQRPGVLL